MPSEAPLEMVAPATIVHVIASEELEPDILRALARPFVTLWLSTRSNTLRESTIDTLRLFPVAWVQLRAPLASVDAGPFRSIPKVGWWVDVEAAVSVSVSAQRGARALAVDVEGRLGAPIVQSLAHVRPFTTRWTPHDQVDLLEWAMFRTLPGRKVLIARPPLLLPRECQDRSGREPAVQLHVATLLAMSSAVFPCGVGPQVVVSPDVEPWLLKSLIVRDPSVELVVRVGDDPRKVGQVRLLLQQLGR
jgi:hypothetical protein